MSMQQIHTYWCALLIMASEFLVIKIVKIYWLVMSTEFYWAVKAGFVSVYNVYKKVSKWVSGYIFNF